MGDLCIFMRSKNRKKHGLLKVDYEALPKASDPIAAVPCGNSVRPSVSGTRAQPCPFRGELVESRLRRLVCVVVAHGLGDIIFEVSACVSENAACDLYCAPSAWQSLLRT